MSETEQKKELTCDDCGEEMTLQRNPYHRLFVSCACEESKERPIKVETATPPEW